MNSNLIKVVPVIVLALGLSACGEDTKSATQAPSTVTRSKIETTYQSQCGEQPSAAVASAFDVTECHLNGQQLELLRGVGPLSVDASCVQKTVEIRNAAGEIAGAGPVADDGTYNVELQAGQSFSELGGCPVSLTGRATGTVACKEDKVESVTINTTFNFSKPEEQQPGDTTGGSVAAVELALADELQPAPAEDEHADDLRPAPIPSPRPKGAPLPLPSPKGKGAPIVKGKPQPIPTPTKGAPLPLPSPKGHQGKGKGGQQGGGHHGGGHHGGGSNGGPNGSGSAVPGAPVEACVTFAPCVFSSSATVSCQAQPAAQPAEQPAAQPAGGQPAQPAGGQPAQPAGQPAAQPSVQ